MPASRTRAILFVAAALLAACLSVQAAEIVKVMRIVDGDTFTASADGRLLTVRMAAIDAPETSKSGHDPGQPYARKAWSHLADMILHHEVEIRRHGADRYGRVLAEVFRDGRNVNLEMVSCGLAEVYRGRPASGLDMDSYRRAEADARLHRREMWALGEQYVSPLSWRRLERHPF